MIYDLVTRCPRCYMIVYPRDLVIEVIRQESPQAHEVIEEYVDYPETIVEEG